MTAKKIPDGPVGSPAWEVRRAQRALASSLRTFGECLIELADQVDGEKAAGLAASLNADVIEVVGIMARGIDVDNSCLSARIRDLDL